MLPSFLHQLIQSSLIIRKRKKKKKKNLIDRSIIFLFHDEISDKYTNSAAAVLISPNAHNINITGLVDSRVGNGRRNREGSTPLSSTASLASAKTKSEALSAQAFLLPLMKITPSPLRNTPRFWVPSIVALYAAAASHSSQCTLLLPFPAPGKLSLLYINEPADDCS